MTTTPSSSDDSIKPPVRRRVRSVLPSPPAPSQDDPPEPQHPKDQAEKVGYRSPPVHSRFKPGFDPRRPRGRKAGSTNKANSIVAMMESPTSVRNAEGDVRTISTADALARKLRELGLSGQVAAIVKAFEFYHRAQPPANASTTPAEPPAALTPGELSAADQAILAWYEEEIKARAKQGPKS